MLLLLYASGFTRSKLGLMAPSSSPVAHGFQQEYGRDYNETFALVAHMTVVRTIIVASVR